MKNNISQILSFEPVEQKTVTERIANRMVKLLSSGNLKPGDKLPSERELARQLTVGRTSVREALKLLTLSGLLDARRGDGTYVNTQFMGALTSHIEWSILLNTDELDRVVEVREALEIKSAHLAAQHATPEDLQRIAVYKQLAEIDGRDFKRETELDMVFHEVIAAGAHNELLSGLMFSLREVLWKYINLSIQMTESIETTIAEHEAIYTAIANHDPDAAEKAMSKHLSISRKEIQKVTE